MTGLKHLRHRRHEVIVMHVLDPAEVDFLSTNHAVRDPAKTRRAGGPGLTQAYLAEFGRYIHKLKAGCCPGHRTC